MVSSTDWGNLRPDGTRYRDTQPINRRVRFIKAWGHPTRNLIMGVGEVAQVSQRIGESLVSGGYAEFISQE